MKFVGRGKDPEKWERKGKGPLQHQMMKNGNGHTGLALGGKLTDACRG